MTPIAPMKSSTLSSFSVLVDTFLKYTPAFLPTIDSRIRGCSCAAGRAANTKPTAQAVASAPAARLTFEDTFISFLRNSAIWQSHKISDQASFKGIAVIPGGALLSCRRADTNDDCAHRLAFVRAVL